MAPAKYKEWLEEDNLILLGAWARDGLTDEQIAENMGIAPSTLYEWKKKYTEISEALRKNKAIADAHVENAMYRLACGYEYAEEQLIKVRTKGGGEATKIRKIKKYKHPEAKAQMNWLMNRNPDKWRMKKYPKELEDLYNAMTKAEIDKLLADINKTNMETEKIRQETTTTLSEEELRENVVVYLPDNNRGDNN